MSYDPVEPHALQPDALQASVDDALRAIAKAADLDELKAARLAHAGDRSPLALANREIGTLPPAAKAAAGRRIGAAQAQVRAAIEGRQAQLEIERDSRVLVDEASAAVRAWDYRIDAARPPLTSVPELLRD